MVSRGPVPSRAAINALRGIVFGTSCSLALIAEERRRRTEIAWTIVENGKLLRSQRCYHGGGLATIRAQYDTSAAQNAATVGLRNGPDGDEVDMAGNNNMGGREEENMNVEEWLPGSIPTVPTFRETVVPASRIPKTTKKRLEAAQEAMDRLKEEICQQTGSARAHLSALNNAHATSKKSRIFPPALMDQVRIMQQLFQTRGDHVSRAHVFLLLARDPRVDNISLLSQRPGDIIAKLINPDDFTHLDNIGRCRRFFLAGEIMGEIADELRGAHFKRYNRVINLVCRLLTLDRSGQVSSAFLKGCGEMASMVSTDMTEFYSKFDQEDIATWQRNLSKVRIPPARKKPVVKTTYPVERPWQVNALFGDMKDAIAADKHSEAVELFLRHVQNNSPLTESCLAMAVQSADIDAKEMLSKKAMDILEKASAQGYDITKTLSWVICQKFDDLEASMTEESLGPHCMYPHAAKIVYDTYPFIEDLGLLSYNRMTRACLCSRDYIGAVRLLLISLQLHGNNDIFHHPYITSNLIFALSALGEYRLLSILLDLLPDSPLVADGIVKKALARAKRRVRVAGESALWSETRRAHAEALRVLTVIYEVVITARKGLSTPEEANDSDSGVSLDTDDDAEIYLQQGDENLKAEVDAVEKTGWSINEVVERGMWTGVDVVDGLQKVLQKFDGAAVGRKEVLRDVGARRTEARKRMGTDIYEGGMGFEDKT